MYVCNIPGIYIGFFDFFEGARTLHQNIILQVVK